MAFDWQRFLSSRGIPYITHGKNVGRGHIATHCPFCGSSDEGMHMEIHLEGRGWRCFKNSREHKGKKATRLVQKLLQCSFEAAAAITEERTFLPNDYYSNLRSLMQGAAEPTRSTKPLKLPVEFKPFDGPRKPSSDLFVNYLLSRGFDMKAIRHFTHDFSLRYANRGLYQNRIIFPVYFKGKLITWTGRAIGKALVRYKTLSPNADEVPRNEPIALGPISDYLLWHDEIKAGRFHTFVLVEGPFDALKINVLGNADGICASCCFTALPSEAQIELLHDLVPRMRRRVIMLDRKKTQQNSMLVSKLLSSLDFKTILLKHVDDPGELRDLTLLK